MPTASCHCGAVRLELARRPRTLTDCNCSICRRYGALWAYYKASAVRVVCRRGALSSYSWGDKTLRFFRCNTCGCITHHERTRKRPDSTVGVNARNLEPAVIAAARIRRLDGASTWRYLD
jgi:hypothetical protein